MAAKKHNSLTPEERYDMLKYAERYGVRRTLEKYKCTERTFYRWKAKYDGSLDSLRDIEQKQGVHPNALKEVEIEKIKEHVTKNPYITDGELVKILGTNRNRTVIRKYRNRLFGKDNLDSKAEIATMFNTNSVNMHNKKDFAIDKDFDKAYLIEVNNSGIYIGKKRTDGNAAFLTVYYGTALKFNTLAEAQDYIDSIDNKSSFILNIKEIKE